MKIETINQNTFIYVVLYSVVTTKYSHLDIRSFPRFILRSCRSLGLGGVVRELADDESRCNLTLSIPHCASISKECLWNYYYTFLYVVIKILQNTLHIWHSLATHQTWRAVNSGSRNGLRHGLAHGPRKNRHMDRGMYRSIEYSPYIAAIDRVCKWLNCQRFKHTPFVYMKKKELQIKHFKSKTYSILCVIVECYC